MFRTVNRSVLALAALVAATSAQAQDLPDDLFGEETATPEPTIRQEKDSLLAENPDLVVPEEKQRRRVIQTFQQKNFLKLGRYEPTVHVGFVTNDPFVNRYLLGVGMAYHITEIFAVEVTGTFSPDLGDADYKPVTEQLIEQNGVTPDISKIEYYLDANFQFSPIYGKIALGANKIINFDIFGVFGTGVVRTRDDLEARGQTDDPDAVATQAQFHPSLDYGGGLRVVLSEGFAVRVEGRGLSYVEVIESSTLEMKNNFTLLASASLFFPGMD